MGVRGSFWLTEAEEDFNKAGPSTTKLQPKFVNQFRRNDPTILRAVSQPTTLFPPSRTHEETKQLLREFNSTDVTAEDLAKDLGHAELQRLLSLGRTESSSPTCAISGRKTILAPYSANKSTILLVSVGGPDDRNIC